MHAYIITQVITGIRKSRLFLLTGKQIQFKKSDSTQQGE